MGAHPKSVLIVEDEAFIAWDLADMLGDEGFDVVGPAATLSEGMNLAQAEAIDFALLDINLGPETVWPLAERLEGMKVPFLLVTADLRHPELSGRFSHAPRLGKPAQKADILAAIRQARDLAPQVRPA